MKKTAYMKTITAAWIAAAQPLVMDHDHGVELLPSIHSGMPHAMTAKSRTPHMTSKAKGD